MEHTKIKLFGPKQSKDELEQVMNEYLSKVESCYINDIQFNVTRILLPTGEFQTFWYGMVSIDEEN